MQQLESQCVMWAVLRKPGQLDCFDGSFRYRSIVVGSFPNLLILTKYLNKTTGAQNGR